MFSASVSRGQQESTRYNDLICYTCIDRIPRRKGRRGPEVAETWPKAGPGRGLSCWRKRRQPRQRKNKSKDRGTQSGQRCRQVDEKVSSA